MIQNVLLGCCFCGICTVPQLVPCRADMKDAFRQVLVEAEGAPVFGYAMGGYVVVDLSLQLGGVIAPGSGG